MRVNPYQIALVWLFSLPFASCFSPTYHNGNLQCTASGQCPKDYHCAVDHSCWHNGNDPGASAGLADSGEPDTTVSSDTVADARDAPQPVVDASVSPDLAAGVEVTGASRDLPFDRDSSTRDTAQPEARDAPAADGPSLTDGSDTAGAEAANLGIPLDQLAADYALVVCARDFACCTQSDLRGKTLAGCQQNVASLLQVAVQAISDGVSRGRTIYYPERARQCLQAIAATRCEAWPLDPITQLPAICSDAIEPLVPNGGPCRSAAECVTRLCVGASSSADGTCLPKAANGETCIQILAQNSCQDELYCDSTSKCSSTKIDGTSCAGNRECKSLTCGAVSDAGNVCLPALCYSNGPLLPPACSFGGRPSAFAGGLVLAVLALVLRRCRSRRERSA